MLVACIPRCIPRNHSAPFTGQATAAGRGRYPETVSAPTTENSGRSRGRVENLRPFKPGQSGNPGGRPKGLVSRIRQQTREGEELVDYMLRVFRDENASRRDRMQAADWLADRGFGKPTQPTRQEIVDVPPGVRLEDLPREQRDALIAEKKRQLELMLSSQL